MRVLFLSLITVIVCGCTITVEDKRITREEVAQAFAQRDALIKQIAEAVQPLLSKKGEKKK